jgi:hypothetical protein
LREALFLISTWYGVSLLVAMLAFLAVVGSEQRQITLLAASPLSRRTFLHGRLAAAALPFGVMLLVTAACGPTVAGVGKAAVGGFLLTAPAFSLYLSGLILMAGTWPEFIAVHDDVPLANNLRTIVPVLVIGSAGGGLFVLLVKIRAALVAGFYGHGIFAGYDGNAVVAWLLVAAWAIGGIVFVLGYAVGARNIERLLAAQPT